MTNRRRKDRSAGGRGMLPYFCAVFLFLAVGIANLPAPSGAISETPAGVGIARAATGELLLPEPAVAGDLSVEEAIARRRSVRSFTGDPIALGDLSQLLWAAQGITGEEGFKRAAPSAGAKYPLEIFVAVGAVEDLEAGLYRYRPETHALLPVGDGDVRETLCGEALYQDWIEDASVVLMITAVYERTMQKYGDRGVRYVHIEVGAASENVYLEAESLGLGTTFVGAFSDEEVKKILGTDDVEPLGLMPVGVRAGS